MIEGGETVALLLATEHLARSPGGVTIALDGTIVCRALDRSVSARSRLFGARGIRATDWSAR